jgi:hypothetical protein
LTPEGDPGGLLVVLFTLSIFFVGELQQQSVEKAIVE